MSLLCGAVWNPGLVIRPFNIYGPGQAAEFLIPTIVKQALDSETQEVSVADDRPRRDYLFLDDLLDLLLRTMNPGGFDVFNAGSGVSVSPRELAALILEIAQVEKPVVSRGEVRPDEVLDTVADIGKAKRVLWLGAAGAFERGAPENDSGVSREAVPMKLAALAGRVAGLYRSALLLVSPTMAVSNARNLVLGFRLVLRGRMGMAIWDSNFDPAYYKRTYQDIARWCLAGVALCDPGISGAPQSIAEFLFGLLLRT